MKTAVRDQRRTFPKLSAVAVPMNQANVDTDQIIPARFLALGRDEMAPNLFRDVRYRDDGAPRPEFVLNRPEFTDAEILVAERNFACGSSREMAVTVLKDNGFDAVIAPSFGDIFYNNCFQNSILPIVLPEARVSELLRFLLELPGAKIDVDLDAQTVKGPDGKVDKFEIDPFRKDCLAKGLSDIELTMAQEAAIAAFEKRTAVAMP